MAKESFAAKLTSIWIGGFFFLIIKGLRGRLNDQYEDKYENRNLWTGYFITLIVMFVLVYFLIRDEIAI